MKFVDLERNALIWEVEKTMGKNPSGNPEQELIDEVKKRFGEIDSFMTEFNPTKQTLLSNYNEAAEGDYPTVKSVCLTYGKESIRRWIYAQLINLAIFANSKGLIKEQTQELSAIIVNECQYLTITEILHFFYLLKSGQYVFIDGKLSPLVIILYMRSFCSRCNARRWYELINKVYLIVEDQPNTRVYARVFKTKEDAEKALEETNNITGERLYPACHIIERTIE